MISRIHHFLGHAALWLLSASLPCSQAFVAVNVTDTFEDPYDPVVLIAVQACVGLYNLRDGGSAYSIFGRSDELWLELQEPLLGAPADLIQDPAVFLQTYCLRDFTNVVQYSYEDQRAVLPNILTVAAVWEALPIDRASIGEGWKNDQVVFDAIDEFKNMKAYEATEYVYETYVDQTTGLSMMNPGYAQNRITEGFYLPFAPPINDEPEIEKIDLVFSQKFFAIFLVNGCIPLTREHEVLNKIAADNPWLDNAHENDPLPVYGYAQYWNLFGGLIFETHTVCSEERNMGAIPTVTSNLAFWSTRRPSIELDQFGQSPLVTNPLEDDIVYDPSKTYVAMVVGDGDNIGFMLDQRRDWILDRLEACQTDPNNCPPLTWTISPHLHNMAPDILQWYYDIALQTGHDYFMIPPTGHLYAYPTLLDNEEQDRFITLTEEDSQLLKTRSVVHWEWNGYWTEAIRDVLPKYIKEGRIEGIFPVNVPYLLPILTNWGGRKFKILHDKANDGNLVLFKPRQWRGPPEGGLNPSTPTPREMADELGDYPRGTVAGVYMTSDGGLNLTTAFFPMLEDLPDHVVLVSADTATRLALEADAHEASQSWCGWARGFINDLF